MYKLTDAWFWFIPLFALCMEAHAQRLLPRDLKPLQQPVKMTYVAGHSASCDGHSGGELKQFAESFELRADGREFYSASLAFEGKTYFESIQILTERHGFYLELLPRDDTSKVGMVKRALAATAEMKYGFNMFKAPLKQGDDVYSNFCLLFGEGVSSVTSAFKVLGEATIKGRRSLIVGGSRNLQCEVSGKDVLWDTKGWMAYDIDSGLMSELSHQSEMGLSGNQSPKQSLLENWSCTNAGSPSVVPEKPIVDNSLKKSNSDNNIEKRLQELKNLYDKGLISKDVYQQRQSDLLKDL
jgi:hypothetical protein